ncbi:response regulator transcription factor [Leptolyngbya sp. AN02str]|uniref:response regulator transcription factor n=1 Tax=Leptolyngbya sp. AN02str TaxID=3423363 RepID=UPI003D31F700
MARSLTPNQSRQLSERELEVLNLLVEGRSNPEIAAALYLSPNTVKTHVKSIMNKFGVNDRVQTAVFALRNGFV